MALAVSGGGDSMAMLHLAASQGLTVHVVTVDHGLRPEAAAEAAEVGRVSAELGLPHQILHWHWDGTGNLQDAARRGRRQVMAEWARGAGLTAVALAHTQDDVAETFLMRLARGAGVDGLAAMAGNWTEGGVDWVRPLLQVSRAELRGYLQGIGAAWIEDPSNDNDRFDRVRARKALGMLAPVGITAAGLAQVAANMAEARHALEAATDRAAADTLTPVASAVRLDRAALATHSPEIQRRVLLRVIQWLSPSDYGPRGEAVQGLLESVLAGKAATLAGCRFAVAKNQMWAFREARAVADLTCGPEGWWDGSWQILGDWPNGAEIRALGDGISRCPQWRDSGLPRAAVVSSPALWLCDQLISAPAALFGPGFSLKPLLPATRLHHSAISH